MQLEIEGRAAPFSTYNVYNEGFAPGAFTRFIDSQQPGGELPMLMMHEGRPVGKWTELTQRKDGLYVRGVIRHREAREIIAALPELSVSFMDEDSPDVHTNARNEYFEQTGFHIPRYLRNRAVERKLTKHAALAEISLVDKGAFAGTFYRVLN